MPSPFMSTTKAVNQRRIFALNKVLKFSILTIILITITYRLTGKLIAESDKIFDANFH
jgi:hypothetical protein